MTKIYGINYDYPLSKAALEAFDYAYSPNNKPSLTTLNTNADDTKYYYGSNGGTVNVDMGTARHHIVQLFGVTDFTVALTGTVSAGKTLKIGHNSANKDTKFTVSGKTMYAPDQTNSTSHTFTGGGWVEMTAFDGTSLMVIAGGAMR